MASPEAKQEAVMLMEKHLICRIYWSIFHPNGGMDHQKDHVFHTHIQDTCKTFSMEHDSIQINPKLKLQAPWTLAQKELIQINAYKAPGDKMNCVSKCCKTIMHLITLNPGDSGAEELLPILVYVIIQSNPPNLLSTIQYIATFH